MQIKKRLGSDMGFYINEISNSNCSKYIEYAKVT